MINYKINFKNN